MALAYEAFSLPGPCVPYDVSLPSSQIFPMTSFYLVWGGPMRGSRLFLGVSFGLYVLNPNRRKNLFEVDAG
eukprot:12325810-Karenia_brevis.AAC.1